MSRDRDVEHRSGLQILNSGDCSMKVVVEPWANEYQVLPKAELTVVAINTTLMPSFGVEPVEKGLIVWVHESGSIYEVWRGTDMVDRTDNAIPQMP